MFSIVSLTFIIHYPFVNGFPAALFISPTPASSLFQRKNKSNRHIHVPVKSINDTSYEPNPSQCPKQKNTPPVYPK